MTVRTVPVTSTKIWKEIGMATVTEPKFLQWEEGQVIEGVLIAIERCMIGEPAKPAARFVVSEGYVDDSKKFVASGELLAFLGTADLIQKIRTQHKNHFICIRYTGPDHSVHKNGNSMRRFDVAVSPLEFAVGTPSVANDLGITDADIPF